MRTFTIQLSLCLSIACVTAGWAATPEQIARVESLVVAGKHEAALAEVDLLLKAEPNDAALREMRGVLARLAKPAAASQPSPRDRLELKTLELVMRDMAAAAADPRRGAEVKTLAEELLAKSEPLTARMPDEPQLWLYRAAAALALEKIDEGATAGQRLLKLGAADSGDATVVTVMAQLNRKGWLKEGLIEERRAAKERERTEENARRLQQAAAAEKERVAALRFQEKERLSALHIQAKALDPNGIPDLVNAVRLGHVDRLKTYLAAGVPIFDQAPADVKGLGYRGLLYEAIDWSQLEIATVLLNAGASPLAKGRDDRPVAVNAAARGQFALLERIFATASAPTREQLKTLPLLNVAAENDDVHTLAGLLKIGLDPNRETWGETPLQAAVRTRRVNTTKLLIEAGADVNVGRNENRLLAILRRAGKKAREDYGRDDYREMLRSELANAEAIEKILKRSGAK